jgi:ribosomal protein S18 acetylase RimI-like enzyme
MTSSHAISFRPASSFTLDAYADIFTRSFAGYYYPMTMTTQGMAAHVRIENIDLHRSVILMAGDEPAGQATLAIRGDRGWCGGFGIAPAFRGRGYAELLFVEFLAQAQQAGVRQVTLEVLTKNERALKTYTKAGMKIVRETRLFEWVDPAPQNEATNNGAPADMALVTEHFQRFHPVPPVWGRSLPTLLQRAGLKQMTADYNGSLTGYVLFTADNGVARINDLAAEDILGAILLVGMLQISYVKVTSIDEPADSPLTEAFDMRGFREIDRQYELAIDF